MDIWLFTLLCLLGVAAIVAVGWYVFEFFEPLFDEYDAHAAHGFVTGLAITLLPGERTRQWKLLDPLCYVSADGVSYFVHDGFRTDLEPRPAWPCASVLRDYVLHQGVKQRDADALFYEAAIASGVKRWPAVRRYIALRARANVRELINKLRA